MTMFEVNRKVSMALRLISTAFRLEWEHRAGEISRK
jgi:hypothetical protein